eukprot:comp76156_c0_seq1/m.48254 comp76156_c0_seq1/g.48254  ORF comp76156_c0_seq1/g.48254 comp76156_c0_seq1/m.48254 type:complete len:483 (-) comp76156_c0_seq1:276-1724(-)
MAHGNALQHHETGGSEHNLWHAQGFWQEPRLLLDWGTDGKGQLMIEGERKVSWTELFYDLIYVTCIAKLGENLRENHLDFIVYFVGFLTLWNTWYSCSIYSTWLHTDDMFHKILNYFLMLCIVSAGMHFGGGPESPGAFGFCMSFAVARTLLVCAYLRVMYYLPRFRFMGTFTVIGQFVTALIWVGAAVCCKLKYSNASMVLAALSIVWDWAWTFISSALCIPKEKRVPIHLEHMVERFGLFIVIVLGETVTGITVKTEGHEGMIYLAVCLALALVLSLKMLYFDTDIREMDDHALRRGGLPAFTWIFSHSLLAVAMAVLGSGLEFLLSLEVHAEGEEAEMMEHRGRQWVGYSVAAVFLLLGVHSRVHTCSYMCRQQDHNGVKCKLERNHVGLCEFNEAPKCGSNVHTMWLISFLQLCSHVVFGLVMIGLVYFTTPATCNNMCLLGVAAGTAVLLVAINLIDEFITYRCGKSRDEGYRPLLP